MGTHAVQVKCGCGTTIRSENIMGSMVYCHACDSYNIITNNKLFETAVTYKITRFEGKARDFRKVLFDYLYENGHKDLFNEMTSFSLERYYVPVREIGSGNNRKFVQLNEKNRDVALGLFPILPVINYSTLKDVLPDEKTKDLNLTDHQPLYEQRDAEKIKFLPIDSSMSKIDCLYEVSNKEAIVRYIPVFILKTNLVDIVCVGTVESDNDKNFVILNHDEVKKVICEKQIETIGSRIKAFLPQLIAILVGLAIGIAGVSAIYKLFTMGVTARFVFELFMNIFSVVIQEFAAVIMLLIFLFALGTIFAPAIAVAIGLVSALRGEKHKKPNYKKGMILMGLNK